MLLSDTDEQGSGWRTKFLQIVRRVLHCDAEIPLRRRILLDSGMYECKNSFTFLRLIFGHLRKFGDGFVAGGETVELVIHFPRTVTIELFADVQQPERTEAAITVTNIRPRFGVPVLPQLTQLKTTEEINKMCKKTLLTLTVLALASLTAFAATKDGIVLSKDGRMVTATKRTASVVRNESSDAGLVKIYDSLSIYSKATYWCCSGYTILGPTAVSGSPEIWTAAAFTPSANHTITKVKVAVGLIEGTNGLVLSIYSDASGLPGTALKSWNISNLPNFGSCCVVETRFDTAGLAVTGGTQYWVVLKTGAKDSTAFAAWNVNDTDEIDLTTFAQYCSDDQGGTCNTNDAWTAFQTTDGLAFAVLGN